MQKELNEGWKGNNYEQTKKLPLKEIAQRIKKEILENHPEIKLSVSTEFYSGGCSVNVKILEVPFKVYRKVPLYPKDYGKPETEIPKYAWTRQPTEKAQALLDEIQAIANQYRYDKSDSMVDYFETNFYCTPEFDWKITSAANKELGLL